MWNFLLAFFTPFITGDIDFRYGYVFAGCNILGGLLVYFFVLEGQGRTLEEIDTMYLQRVPAWESSSWIAPPAAEIARIRREAGTHEEADLGTGTGESAIARDTLSGETERGEHEAKMEEADA